MLRILSLPLILGLTLLPSIALAETSPVYECAFAAIDTETVLL